MENQFDLTGRVAVITGGAGALGSAMTWGLARAGAAVAVLERRAEKADALAAAINVEGLRAIGIHADVTDKAALESAAAAVEAAFGVVDILVNAAGGNQPTATAQPVGTPNGRTFFDLTPDALSDVMNLNWIGTLLPSQIFGWGMAARGRGCIINISSAASLRPLTRVVGYASAKAAVNNFTQWLAVTMAHEYNPAIRVNAIAPGFFMGEQNRYLLMDAETGELTARGRQIIDHTPMARFGDPDDLVGALLWLVSDSARFVTGIVLPVDGGFSAYSGV
ncbi:MAG: SDR family oxidoreductase [Chloroflexota bacterium]|nr:SDR family oxidoreductase [Chloroflexota bacterium]